MPTPQEQYLQHLRTSDAGGYVPQNAQEAKAERDRLVQTGMSREEATEVVLRRLTGKGPVEDPSVGFLGRMAQNAGDIVQSGWKLASPVRMAMDPSGWWDDVEAARQGSSEAVTRGMQKANEAFARGGIMGAIEGGGRALATIPDMMGLPVSRIADSLASGDVGSAAADATTMALAARPGAMVSGPKAAWGAWQSPRGITGTMLDGVNTMGNRFFPPTPKPNTAVLRNGQPLTPTPMADPVQLRANLQQARATRQAIPPARKAAEMTRLEQLAQQEQMLARGERAAQRASELEAMAPQIEQVLAALEQQPVRANILRNVGASQEARLGTQVAKADAARMPDEWGLIRVSRPDALRLNQSLNRQDALRMNREHAVRQGDIVRRGAHVLSKKQKSASK